MPLEINLPDVVAEVTAEFERYEDALVNNKVDVLDAMFRDSPNTIRYGATECLYGFDEIKAFRAARSMVLAISPEGTRAATRAWRTGYYYIALAAGVPIVMSVLDYGAKTISVSGVIYPTGNYDADYALIRSHYESARGLKDGQFTLDRAKSGS